MLNFDWLSELNQNWAKLLIIVPFLAALLFALMFPNRYIFLGAKVVRPWLNFKLWIFILVVVQIFLYFYF